MKKADKRFIVVCLLLLGISLKVKVKVKRGKTFMLADEFSGEQVCGAVWGYTNRDFYTVMVAEKPNRGLYETIAHELAHIWVMENHPKAKNHGRIFQRISAALRRSLRGWGYDLEPLYLKGVDE